MNDELDPKDLEEEIEDDEMVDEEGGFPKKGKGDLEEDDDSFEDLAEKELFADDDDPYNDVDHL